MQAISSLSKPWVGSDVTFKSDAVDLPVRCDSVSNDS
jgi:hypothetical protein